MERHAGAGARGAGEAETRRGVSSFWRAEERGLLVSLWGEGGEGACRKAVGEL